MKKRLINVIGIAMFILLWQLLSKKTGDVAIVGIDKIFTSLINILKDQKFYSHLLSTLKILCIGIGIAVVLGITVGILIDMSELIKGLTTPVIELLRNIPSITLFPIILVIFGIGDFSRIFIIFWTATPPVIISTIYGLRNIDKEIINASEVFGANKLQRMIYIKFPLAMLEILNGIKIAIVNGFVAIVVAEMLGASKGLGYMVLWATNSFKYNETYAYIIIIAVVGFMANMIMSVIIKEYERRIIWKRLFQLWFVY